MSSGKGNISAKGRGLTNGTAKGSAKGFTNGAGKGFVNGGGKGFTNGSGKGFTNGAGKGFVNGSGKGFTNGSGKGFVNGSGRGITNGAGKGITNGAGKGYTNGSGGGFQGGRGFTNGTGGLQGRFNEEGALAPKKVSAIVVIVLVLLAPISLFMLAQPQGVPGQPINVDGKFGDWEDSVLYADPSAAPDPTIDVTEFSFLAHDTWFYGYLGAAANVFSTDHVSRYIVFIDSDMSAATGYDVRGIGADYLVEISGYDGGQGVSVAKFSGADQQNYAAFAATGSGQVAFLDKRIEFQAVMDVELSNGKYRAAVVGIGEDMAPDLCAPVVDGENGALIVTQSSMDVSGVIQSDNLLSVDLKAVGKDVVVTGITIDYSGTGSVSMGGFTSPMTVSAGTNINLQARGSIGVTPAGGLVKARVKSVIVLNATWTLKGTPMAAYAHNSPMNLTVDGAFGDWNTVPKTTDAPNGAVSPSIDIVEHAATHQASDFYGYLKFSSKGVAFAGFSVPVKKVAPSGGGGGGGGGVSPAQRVAGEDFTRVYLDTVAGGQMVGGIEADYVMVIKGKDGKITSKNLYTYPGMASAGEMLAENGATELEFGAPVLLLGNSTVKKMFVETTDWQMRKDQATPYAPITMSLGTRYYHDREQASFGLRNDAGTTAGDIRSMVVGDFNNDGRDDVAVVANPNVYIYVNDGTPFTGAWTRVDVTSEVSVASIAAADFDNDGWLDLVIGALNVKLLHNDGTPFDAGGWSSNIAGSVPSGVRSVAAADFDNDGWTDVVSGMSASGSSVVVWENSGTPFAGAWASNTVGTTVVSVNSVAAADFDNDGLVDVAIGTASSVSASELRIWKNPGAPFSGTWTGNNAGDIGGVTMNAIKAVDMDNDGWTDLVSGSPTGAGVEVVAWYNNWNPFTGAWTPNILASSIASVNDLNVADIDNDGYPDILAGCTDSQIRCLTNTKDPFGTSFPVTVVGTADAAVYAVAAGDFDNDGDADVASGCGSSGATEFTVWEDALIHRNAAFDPAVPMTSDSTVMASADFNNDGADDIVTGNVNGDIVLWQNPIGDAAFSGGWWSYTIASIGSPVRALAAADFDNDGAVDVAAGTGTLAASSVYVWRNPLALMDPFANAWTTTYLVGSSGTMGINSLAPGDLDGDGRPDLCAGLTSGAGNLRIWRCPATPFASAWTSYDVATMSGNVYGIAVTDLDNNGRPDLVSGSGTPGVGGAVNIWNNTGNPFGAAWQQGSDSLAASDAVYCVASADFDADGDMDIAAGEGELAPTEVLVYSNDWHSDHNPFNLASWGLYQGVSTSTQVASLAACDLDADGWPDIVAGTAAGAVYAFGNDRTPFTGAWNFTALKTALGTDTIVVIRDFNCDGRPDVAFVEEGTSVSLVKNIGAQIVITCADESPGTVAPGSEYKMMRLTARNNGKPSDAAAELAEWRFKFFDTTGNFVTDSDMTTLFESVTVYLDDGDGIWNPASDTVVLSVAPATYLADFVFTDGDALCALNPMVQRTYYLAVKLNAGAASASIATFYLSFDPDGYSTGDWNQAENRAMDVVVSVQDHAQVDTIHNSLPTAPEFGTVLAPIAILFIPLVAYGYKRRKGGL